VLMDGRYMAHIGTGTNGAFAAAWILLDTFATGQEIPTAPQALDQKIYLPVVIR